VYVYVIDEYRIIGQNDSCLNTTTPYAATTDAADTAGAADAAAGGAGAAVLALPAMSMTTTAHTSGCTGSACSEGWQAAHVACEGLTSPPTPSKTRLTLATTPPFRTSCTFWRVQGSAWDAP
jgi:hypothetical protein